MLRFELESAIFKSIRNAFFGVYFLKNFLLFLFVLSIASISGCATVSEALPEQDLKAKSFSQNPSKASLYIYRNENFGAAIPMAVTVNGQPLGVTGPKSYFHLDLHPGKYSIDSKAEATANLPLQTEAGKIYFIWQEVKMGFVTMRSQLHLVDGATGRAGVLESRLLTSVTDALQIRPQSEKSGGNSDSRNRILEKIKELRGLLDDGVISQLEFEKIRDSLIEK